MKIQSQKHGHITAKDTFIDKEDIRNERGKKYSIFEYQAVVINRYSGAIDIFGNRKMVDIGLVTELAQSVSDFFDIVSNDQ